MENDIVRMLFLRRQRQKKRWKIKTISGAPPLSFKAKAGALKDYRIYGNTVDGESVGDRTGNLFNENTLISPIGSLSWYFDNHYLMSNSSSGDGRTWTYDKSQFKFLLSPGTYCLSFDIPIIETTRIFSFIMCDDNNTEILFDDLKNRASYSKSFTINNNTNIGIMLKVPSNIKIRIMLNSGSTPLPYEPYGYRVPVTVEGKNLAKNNHAVSSALFTVEEVNNFIHVSGTNNSGSTIAYVISAGNSFPVGTYDIVNNSNTAIMYDYRDENDVLVSANVNANSIKTFNFPAVFTRKLNVFKSVSNGNSIDNYFQVMIVKHGDGTDTYEPYHAPVTTPIYLPEQIRKVGDEAEYIDYGEQKQHRVRKNLLQNTATSRTINGITFTVNEDGSVTCNGTASEMAIIRLTSQSISLDNTKSYTLTGCPLGGSSSTYVLSVYRPSGTLLYSDKGDGVTFSLDTIHVRVTILAGYTCNNLTFYPMIRKADIEDDTYEPYIENTEVDVVLPELPTLAGTNVLTVGTEVQPSGVEITGRIKKGE